MIPGRPPKAAAKKPIITALHSPTMGLTPATKLKPTASGIIARLTVAPDKTCVFTPFNFFGSLAFISNSFAFVLKFSTLVTFASSEEPSASQSAEDLLFSPPTSVLANGEVAGFEAIFV